MVANSGEFTTGVPFVVDDGVRPIGKAQRTQLDLVASVDDRGISTLKNPHILERQLAHNIRFPMADSVAMVRISYVIRGLERRLMTGYAANTVRILPDGRTEWLDADFAGTILHNTFEHAITFTGLNLDTFSRSAAINLDNAEGNGKIEALVGVEIYSLG